jgi:hypothetical protein
MARPTKLTPALRRAVCTMLQNGVPEKTAALAAGIAESTHHDWMAKGRDAKSGIHRDYFEAVETAKAKAEAKAVRALTKSRDWRAQLAFLERVNPGEWARLTAKQRELAGVGGGADGGEEVGPHGDESTDDQAGL